MPGKSQNIIGPKNNTFYIITLILFKKEHFIKAYIKASDILFKPLLRGSTPFAGLLFIIIVAFVIKYILGKGNSFFTEQKLI